MTTLPYGWLESSVGLMAKVLLLLIVASSRQVGTFYWVEAYPTSEPQPDRKFAIPNWDCGN